MSPRKSRGHMWSHPKKGKQLFQGRYRRDNEGEREFILVNCERPRDRVIPFNSHEDAKYAGWIKSK